MEYVELVLETRDSGGSTRLRLEGLEHEEVKERVLRHLNYVFGSERFVDVVISARDEESEVVREFRKLTRARAFSRVMEFINYLYGVEEPEAAAHGEAEDWVEKHVSSGMTQKEKLLLLLKHHHRGKWVRSQELREEYEALFGEKIKLSSISTYLARFHEAGLLERRGSRAQWEYRLTNNVKETSSRI